VFFIRKGMCAVLFTVPCWAFAQHHEAGMALPGVQSKPTLAVGAAFDATGRIWLAQVKNQHVLVSYSEDGGAGFSEPVQATSVPETIAAEGENRPKIAVAADGVVLLSWTQALPQKYSGNIRFARSVDGGKTFSTPVTLNDDGRITSHRFDSLAIDGKGRVVVAWLDARDRDAVKEKGGEFSGVSVYSAQSKDNGAHFSANRRVTRHVCECCRTGITWVQDGPVMLWRNLYGKNTRDFAVSWLDSGVMRRASDDEWQIDACPHHGGGIAADGGGALHLVWFTQGKTRQGLFYKRIDGQSESPAMALGNPAAQAGHPGVAAAGNTVILTWREFNGRAYVVQAMRSDDSGASWTPPMLLAESAGAADYPVPLVDGKRALVVWNTAVEGLRVLPAERGTGK
jgi:hypothetical protein